MNKDPNIIINIGGEHPGRSIISGIIANALEQSGVKNIVSLDYDQASFKQMREAISLANHNNLSSAIVLMLEWDEIEQVDNMFTEVEDPIPEASDEVSTE